MSNTESTNIPGAIAIIGMTGRFPGAKNIEEFWDNLKNGVESVRFFNREQLIASGIDDYLLDNPKFVAADAILDDMDLFDASFFDYSAREAEIMDPQHRLFLESAWEVMESAGYNSELYTGRVAVFAGSALSGYMIRNINTNPDLVKNTGTFKIMIANSQDFLATRVSYKLNLSGPSVNVNTLCSSSMVGVHLGCQNLLNYNCDLAIAGGVSFQISRNEAFFYQEGGIGASDGHCRAFDSKANGTVSGSGLGVVILKRLEDALEDGDHIYAIIRGSAVNNDGSSKNSFTAPNVDGQAECIAEALAMAEVDPETISYIEAHGTGTNLGDPIEIAALTKVFRSYTQKKNFCAVGSVKTNIGHLVTAGGVASMIKTALGMNHHLLPPSLNFEEPNPKIDFANSPFYVQNALTKWGGNGTPLRAGVSSFGIGGTNVHVVLEEAPQLPLSERSHRSRQLITFSAKTETALQRMTDNLVAYLKENPEANLADVAFTLQVGRRSFNHRRMVVCRDIPDLIAKLSALNPAEVTTRVFKPKDQGSVFLFPGFEPGNPIPGREIYQTEAIFRQTVDECLEILKNQYRIDIQPMLFAGSPIAQNNLQRAAKFVIEYALAKLWMEWEVEPQLLMGRETGEYTAACLAGVFSLEDALGMVSATEAELSDRVKRTTFREPEIPMISSVTGVRLTKPEAMSPDYWVKLLHSSPGFAEGLQEIYRDPDQIIVTMGPGQSIQALTPNSGATPSLISALGSDPGDGSELQTLFYGLGQFWLAGGRVNWFKVYVSEKRRRIPLPTYPFERQRYWIEPGKRRNQEAEPGIQITNQEDITKLLKDSTFKPEAVSLSLSLSPESIESDPQKQQEQLEQVLRFQASLAEFCQNYFAGAGLRVNVSPVEVKTSKGSESGGLTGKNQLPKRPRPELTVDYNAPRNEMERIIAECWQNTLGFDRIGIHDDFFELGGHSLLAAAVANELSKTFQVQIPLRNLFETTTIVAIAELIETYRWAAAAQTPAEAGDDLENGEI